jgi:hypothetical protein
MSDILAWAYADPMWVAFWASVVFLSIAVATERAR